MSGEPVGDPDERYWAYRERVARIPRSFGYVATDPLTGKPVPFDGCRPRAAGGPGTLLHAVDERWAAALITGQRADGKGIPVLAFLLELAERQVRAARGRPIEWHAASAATAAAIGRVLEENRLARPITVVHDPGRSGAGRAHGAQTVRVSAGQRPGEESGPPCAAVYWGDRPENADQCARRFIRMMNSLEEAGLASPLGWLAAVPGCEQPVPLIMDRHAVAQLLLAGGQYTNDNSTLVPELGYRLHAVAAGAEPAAVTVRCGMSVGQAGAVNGVILTLGGGEDAQADLSGRSAAGLRSVVAAWQPDSELVSGAASAGVRSGDDLTGRSDANRNGPA